MKILIELSLCINLIINFFIIKCTAKCIDRRARFAFLASLVASLIALIIPIFNVGIIANLVIQIFLSLFMCLLCFEIKPFKKFLITYAIFFGFTFLFGGACYGVNNIFGQISLVAVLGLAFVIYLVCMIVIKYQNRVKKLKQFSFKVALFSGENKIEEEGFLDSGNVLYDPVTKKPIILITYDIFSKLKPDINYLTAYCKKVDTKKLEGGHYVKINTVASGTSILVFTADKVEIYEGKEKKDYKNVSLGLSFSGFDKALGRKILLHREFA